MQRRLYGVAYYDEYMPYDRLDQDIQMMQDAGINLVRIAESTWSTHEPHSGVFDFSSVDRVLAAMARAGTVGEYRGTQWPSSAHRSLGRGNCREPGVFSAGLSA